MEEGGAGKREYLGFGASMTPRAGENCGLQKVKAGRQEKEWSACGGKSKSDSGGMGKPEMHVDKYMVANVCGADGDS